MVNSLPSENETPRGLVAEFLQNSPSTPVEASITLLRAILGVLSWSLEQAELNALVAYALHRAAIDCHLPSIPSDRNAPESVLAGLRLCMNKYDDARALLLMQAFWHALVGALSSLIGEHVTLLHFRRALRVPKASKGNDC
jgi:hypothetical protein